jgi:hypothetical protein
MIPKPVPRTIWPASHPAMSPTSNVIVRHVQFRILRQGGGRLSPAPVKLSRCKDRNGAKLLTSPQNEHV